MKAKSFLFSVLFLAAILVGCEQPQTKPEGEANSYITVSVKSSMASRAATDGGYIEGKDAENAITSIDFYFFATTGEPFKFNSPVTAGSTSGYSNLYIVEPGQITTSTNKNVEEVVNVTLALQHNLGDYPGSVVAIVNGTQRFENLPIEEFRTHTFNSYKTTNGFLMSNSVYMGEDGKEVFQTYVTPENFSVTAAAAQDNPIEIYVERSAVRVEVAQKGTETKFDTGYDFIDKSSSLATSTDVYAKITGWDIVTVPTHAYTVKKIDTSWGEEINGFKWNKPADFRSYWADAQWTNEGQINKAFKYNQLTNAVGLGNYDYTMENTTLPEYVATPTGVHDQVASKTNITKALIAADLVDAAGNSVQIATWYGSDYTIEGLKVAVANSLKEKMFYYNSENKWVSIDPTQIKIVQGSGLKDEEKSYEVYFQLTEEARKHAWAKDNLGGEGILDSLEQQYIRQNVEVAKVWNGKTYYIVDIQHLGVTEMNGETYLPAYYGTVRNHAYQITFSAVKGLGTPVYDPGAIIPEPVKPDDTESFIEAKINVLSWHLIKQDVTLQ